MISTQAARAVNKLQDRDSMLIRQEQTFRRKHNPGLAHGVEAKPDAGGENGDGGFVAQCGTNAPGGIMPGST